MDSNVFSKQPFDTSVSDRILEEGRRIYERASRPIIPNEHYYHGRCPDGWIKLPDGNGIMRLA